MNFFGYKLPFTKENKSASGFGGSFSSMITGVSEEKPMNFNTYYDMYARNADIKSCVREIQNTAGKSGFKISKKTGKKDHNGKPIYKEIDENVFISSFFTESARNLTRKEEDKVKNIDNWAAFNMLKKEFIKHKKISGNLFLLKKRNAVNKIHSVKVLDARNVSIITNVGLEVLYYVVRQGGSVYQVSPENMYHFVSTYDVQDEVFGGTDLSGIIYHAYGDNEASISNYFAMLNNSVPAGLYVLKDGVDEKTGKRILDEVKNAVTGSKNRNKSIVSNAIAKFEQMANTHKDMNFVEMQEFNSKKICSAMGVPKEIINYNDNSNYSNGEIQYKKFIENTIRPEEEELNLIFTTILGDILPDLWFECIDNHINDKENKLDIAEKAVKNGFWNRNEAREYIGNDRVEEDLMDSYTVDMGVKLIEDLEFDINDPSYVPQKEEDDTSND